mmetsp:Transcript_69297/g.133700  ORF Transcript_69297/g.133700 Transcript_69297/m.133700 type:complete len:201 (-) Transcript_69297:72-674(-)
MCVDARDQRRTFGTNLVISGLTALLSPFVESSGLTALFSHIHAYQVLRIVKHGSLGVASGLAFFLAVEAAGDLTCCRHNVDAALGGGGKNVLEGAFFVLFFHVFLGHGVLLASKPESALRCLTSRGNCQKCSSFVDCHLLLRHTVISCDGLLMRIFPDVSPSFLICLRCSSVESTISLLSHSCCTAFALGGKPFFNSRVP